MNQLPDVQADKPLIGIAINRVGVTDVKVPVYIKKQEGGHQHTVADVSCYVDLKSDKKGINMSRIPIAITKFLQETLSGENIKHIAQHIMQKSEAEECQLIYKFPYFVTKLSPVAKEPGVVHYDVEFNGTIDKDENWDFTFSINAICTTLCPCSKEISQANAHNQKCYIKITVNTSGWVWVEDVINIAETSSSCEIFSVLKRPDEKFVTEEMYNNPRFVEDVVREVYQRMVKLENVKSFTVEATADESIHMHKAYAKLEVKEIP